MFIRVPASRIQQAGEYILNVLRTKESIHHSDFYNGNVELASILEASSDLSQESLGYEGVWTIINEAIGQLERQELITTEMRVPIKRDVEIDYTLRLSKEGREGMGTVPTYKGIDEERGGEL